jgi:hypothetical protein
MRAFLIACVFALAGCSPNVPNKVTPDEYQLYSEWTIQHFAVKTPDHVFFSSRTFTFDPLERFGCGDRLHKDNGVSWSLIKQLHALGEGNTRSNSINPVVICIFPGRTRKSKACRRRNQGLTVLSDSPAWLSIGITPKRCSRSAILAVVYAAAAARALLAARMGNGSFATQPAAGSTKLAPHICCNNLHRSLRVFRIVCS